MRKKIIAGNWKMNKTVDDAIDLSSSIMRDYADCTGVDIVLCPPFTAIKSISDVVSDSQIQIGAQNMYYEDSGAFTGEISAPMLKDLFVKYVIIGHSERRELLKENDAIINKKVTKALEKKLVPILCVGETLTERESDFTKDVVGKQLEKGLLNISPENYSDLVIAYEPVWAIGTGKTATADQAQDVHKFIRDEIERFAGNAAASSVRIQYGGSMKPNNAKELLSQPDIDGGLIGGAALDPQSFGLIIDAAKNI